MAKIISFFNHKGGVGKTTAVHNLSCTLSEKGHKVLAVDADPQMNLTASVYGLSTSATYTEDIDSKWREFNNTYTSLDEVITNIITTKNKEALLYEKQPERYKNGCLHLMPSSLNLASLEADIVDMIKRNNQLDYGKFYELEQNFRNNIGKNYDFILIDFSPSASSAINAILMMMSDYFVVPVSPTFFSLQAVDNLSNIFRSWANLLSSHKQTSTTNGLSFKPKFLGLVVLMAKRRHRNGKMGYSEPTKEWVSRVNKSVLNFQQDLLDSGRSISRKQFESIFPERTPFIIEIVNDFAMEIRSRAEKAGIAEVELSEDDLPKRTSIRKDTTGNNIKINQTVESLTLLKKSYSYMADNLIKLV